MKPLIAVLAVVAVASAAGIGFLSVRNAGAEPDPWAGGPYPMVTPKPTNTPDVPTWTPRNPPKGPLPRFKGTRSKVIGRIVDRTAGVSYARFATPWKGLRITSHTGGQEIKSKANGLEKFWYVAVYSEPLAPDMRPAVPKGPQGPRATAELSVQDFADGIYGTGDPRTELAGAPMKIDGHRAWVTAARFTHTDSVKRVVKSQTHVVVAVDTGRDLPAIVSITVPSNMQRLLADINTIVDSIHVV